MPRLQISNKQTLCQTNSCEEKGQEKDLRRRRICDRTQIVVAGGLEHAEANR